MHDGRERVQMEGEERTRVEEFKYPGQLYKVKENAEKSEEESTVGMDG